MYINNHSTLFTTALTGCLTFTCQPMSICTTGIHIFIFRKGVVTCVLPIHEKTQLMIQCLQDKTENVALIHADVRNFTYTNTKDYTKTTLIQSFKSQILMNLHIEISHLNRAVEQTSLNLFSAFECL